MASTERNTDMESPVSHRKTLSHEEVVETGEKEALPPPDISDPKKVTPPVSRAGSSVLQKDKSTDEPIDQDTDIEGDADEGRQKETEIGTLEIAGEEEEEYNDEDDDIDSDLTRLLGNAETKDKPGKQVSGQNGVCGCKHVGNFTICCVKHYERTGWPIIGPHAFGPVCVLLLLGGASQYFIRRALTIGPISAGIAVIFMILTAYNLIDAAFRDPGIVTESTLPTNAKDVDQWRWCDICNNYQPPDGAHCPECNCCIAGYDHHCVWMGTCIGKKNFKQFIRFNLCWLGYLIYSVSWISFIGPAIYHHKKVP